MKKRITRLLSGLALGALTATGLAIVDDVVATPQQDTGWGAPDTAGTVVSGPDTDTADDTGSGTADDTTHGDTGWG